MDMYIYGAGVNGKKLYELIHDVYKMNIRIRGFVDREKKGALEGTPILKLEELTDKNATIVIAISKFPVAAEVCELLKEKEYQNIWWFRGEKRIFGQDFWEEQCVSCKGWGGDMLEQAEMHVMDACNLNCRGCTHFSPIFERELPEYDARMNDIRALKGKISHIVRFNLLGGEPFLNPEIARYAKGVREILPDSEIYIVTNGLLIPKIEEDILREVQENKIKISISEYEPTRKVIGEIEKRLEQFGIIYEIRKWTTKQKFNRPLTLDEENGFQKMCISDGCINIWNGKISRCPTLMYIDKFNEYFQTHLPNEGIMQLDSCPSGRELISRLKEQVPLCKHCIKDEIDWSVCGKERKLSDFVAGES